MDKPELPKPIFFALQHKCGNVYFRQALREFVDRTENQYRFLEVNRNEFQEQDFRNGDIVRLRNFSMDDLSGLVPDSKVVACIRDPRSVISSCTDYHMRGDEEWTRQPSAEFGGLSYSQFISEAPSDEERLIISMENRASWVIKRLESFVDCRDFMVVKLEDLSRDQSCSIYRNITQYLELPQDDEQLLEEVLINHSLWKFESINGRLPKHSTSGVSKNSVQRLQGRALERYAELFGDLHIRMGYAA